MRNAVAAGHEVAYGFLQQQGEAPAGSHQGIFGCPAGCPGSGPKQEGRAFMTTRLKSGLLAKAFGGAALFALAAGSAAAADPEITVFDWADRKSTRLNSSH